jgi:hypothetical protein
MSEIMRRQSNGILLPTFARREMTHTVAAAGITQAKIHAKATIGEVALSEVSYLKTIQRQAENANPDAAEAIALIVNVTIAGIARSVQLFSADLD